MSPKKRALALKALRLSRKGLKGKAIADALGLANATEGNDLATHGYLIDRDERSALTDAELLLIRLLDAAEREKTRTGNGTRPRTKFLGGCHGKSRGWAQRTIARRLRTREYDEDEFASPALGFVSQGGGYANLTPAGRALAHVLRGKRRRASA